MLIPIKDMKELEKFGFWKDSNFKTYHRAILNDYIEQFNKSEYLLILKQSNSKS